MYLMALYKSKNAGGRSFSRQNQTFLHTDYQKFIGMPAVRTDGGWAVGVRSRDYQIFWDGQIILAMGLRPRAREELRYESYIYYTISPSYKSRISDVKTVTTTTLGF